MLLFDHKVTKNKWKYMHLCSAISALKSSYRVRCPIGLRSVHDERVWGGIDQKCYFYSFFPIHLGSTMVPITRNG